MKRKRIYLSLFCSFILCISATAQKSTANPLHKLTQEAFHYCLNNPDSAIHISQKALGQALQSGDTYYEGYCYFLFSKAYWVKANFKLSIEYGFKALKIFQNSPHFMELSSTLLSLARTFVELGNFQQADQFIQKALILVRIHSSEFMQAEAFREKSFLLLEQHQQDSALIYSDKGISLYRKFGDSLNTSILYGRKSRIFFQQKKFEKSKQFTYHAMVIDSLVGNRRALGLEYYQLARNDNALHNPYKAIPNLKQAIRICAEIGNLKWLIRSHELLATIYLQIEKPLLAIDQLQLVNSYKDDLYNAEKNGQIQEMQSLHELEAKQSTIKLLEQENALKKQEVKNQQLFLAFLLVGIVLLILLIFVLTRLRSIQKKINLDLITKNLLAEHQKTAMQLQAQNLRQIDQLKSKLFSVVSHDLRGPIANLQSLLDLFTKNLMTADEFIVLSDKLKKNLNVTQRTLENLLNWALSQMDGIKTEKRKIEITSSIEEACRLMEEVATRKNVYLNKQLEAPLHVWADSDQLQLILRNLIHNAIKFSTLNERVEILAYRENNHCQITIKDSGIGMTQKEVNTLTASREHFSKEGTQQEKGTGLGLLLCKEFITRNGGNLQIKSALGSGTEVSFTLMLAEQYN
ncbi:MAG: HAMP domain-containing sensor histidine kinase [Cyclobacteriaceae bacterium]